MVATRRRAAPWTVVTGCIVLRGTVSQGQRKQEMPIRVKKLIGTVLLILLVIVYALVATTVAVARLAESGPLAHFAFFLVGGLFWILPAMAIIKWMMLAKPDAGANRD